MQLQLRLQIDRKKSQELEGIKVEHRKALGEISNLKTMVRTVLRNENYHISTKLIS